MKNVAWIVIGAVCALSPAAPLSAQDLEAMLKWSQAEAIHYDVVAEYAGATPTLSTRGAPVGIAPSQITDRYEISFDWSPTSMAMVGKATWKNFPTNVPEMSGGKCPAPKITGSYDHIEVVDAKTGLPASNSLELSIKRSYPAAVMTYPNENGVCTPLEVPAGTTMDKEGLIVPLGMYFAMPQAVPANITVGKDGKTMTLKDREWTYTYTLRIVK